MPSCCDRLNWTYGRWNELRSVRHAPLKLTARAPCEDYIPSRVKVDHLHLVVTGRAGLVEGGVSFAVIGSVQEFWEMSNRLLLSPTRLEGEILVDCRCPSPRSLILHCQLSLWGPTTSTSIPQRHRDAELCWATSANGVDCAGPLSSAWVEAWESLPLCRLVVRRLHVAVCSMHRDCTTHATAASFPSLSVVFMWSFVSCTGRAS